MTTLENKSYRIKAEFGYFYNTYNAPADGYLMGDPIIDYSTGREYCRPMEFETVADAFSYLTEQGVDTPYGRGDAEGPEADYDGDGQFSAGGTYYTSHGQHSRPVYTIVSRASGRCTKAIIAECDNINNCAEAAALTNQPEPN